MATSELLPLEPIRSVGLSGRHHGYSSRFLRKKNAMYFVVKRVKFLNVFYTFLKTTHTHFLFHNVFTSSVHKVSEDMLGLLM
jgi:hypothetical protein